MFSIALLILILLVEYLAIQKDKQNERRCTQSKFGDRDCTSSTKAVK